MEPNEISSVESAPQLAQPQLPQTQMPQAGLPQARSTRPAREQRTSLRRRALLGAAGLAGVAALTRLARAGELSPPPGPIQPTGTSLHQLSTAITQGDSTLQAQLGDVRSSIGPFPTTVAEPRTPIDSLPSSPDAQFVISKPGAYCLTRNLLQVQGVVCIDIQSDHVDIDGQGFVFDGSGGGGGGLFSSCIRSSDHQAIEIYDCAFRGWQGACCDLGDCDDVHLSDMLFHACVSPPDGATGAAGAVVRCRDRCVIEDVVCSSSTGVAFEFRAQGTFSDGSVLDVTGGAIRCGDGCCIEESSFLRLSGSVLVVGGSCTVCGCELRQCGGLAISTGASCVVECCEVSGGAGGAVLCADSCCVEDCSFLHVTGDVVVTGSSCCVCSCEWRQCEGPAVTVGSSSSVESCDVSGGTGSGIRCADGCCVEDCTVVGRDALAIECGSRCSVSSNHVVLCWGISCSSECSVCDNDLSRCSGDLNVQPFGGAITIHGERCTCEDNAISSCPVGISVQAGGSSSLVHNNVVTGAGAGADPATGPGAGLVVHDAASQVLCTCNHLMSLPGTPPFLPGTSSYGPIVSLSSGDMSSSPGSSHPLCNTVS